MIRDIEIIGALFEHRLQQADLDRILNALSTNDRVELVDKVGGLLEQISRLIAVAHQLSGSRSLDLLLNRLIGIISEVMGAERTSLFLYDSVSNELYSRVAEGRDGAEIRIESGSGIAGSVFHSGKPVIIDNAYADARFNQSVDRDTGFRTRNILCAPLRNTRGEIMGVVEVLNKHRGNFEQDDLILLGALTSQAAAAIENADLLERVESAWREESRLFELANAVASELQLDALLERIVSVTTEILVADRSSLFLHDPKTGELWSRIAEGLTTKEIRFPDSAGVAGACFTAGRVMNISDPYADPRFNREVDRKTGYRTHSILCTPIVNRDGEKLGVLQVLNRKGGVFDERDEQRLRAFASQISIALENARLFESVLNARNYNESILRSLSNGVITLDSDLVVIKVNDAAGRILGAAPDALTGEPIQVVLGAENDAVAASLARVAETGKPDILVDQDLELRDGSSVATNVTVAPLIDVQDEPIGYMVVLEDISREKRIKGTMARYMTREVMDRLLESGDSVLGGSMQEATILFSDIRGFTSMSEALGPRETVSMLNEYFTDMVDVIFDNGGILDKYIGDGLMALFGLPFPGEDDADKAVSVASGMISALRQLNWKRERKGLKHINIGVGVSSGEVIAGNIGSPKRMDYTVIGDCVNLASRLETANKHYGTRVLLCENTAKRLRNDWMLREIDRIQVRGRVAPVTVFEVMDHHTKETFPNLERALIHYEHGLAAFREHDWHKAMTCFALALEYNENDGPAKRYWSLCCRYTEMPPDETVLDGSGSHGVG